MDKHEIRAVSSLAAVFSVRLLGLFMIYPVFATYARQLSGATSYKIGLALGIYGLSQGILQIPFGMLSDKIGRVRVLTWTILIFAVFTGLCALAQGYWDLLFYRTIAGLGLGGEFGIRAFVNMQAVALTEL